MNQSALQSRILPFGAPSQWRRLLLVAAMATCLSPTVADEPKRPERFDVVIYGGTSSGVMAAVQARRMGKSAALVEPSDRLGGMTSGGLGQTDIGHSNRVGGLARDFYRRIAAHYDKPAVWKRESRDEYLARHDVRQNPGGDMLWSFEPAIAKSIFEQFVEEAGIVVFYNERLDAGQGVKLDGQRITSIVLESGTELAARVFIDATYEGDLMAAAGVTYTFGRESRDQYEESFNGVRLGSREHQLKKPIDPNIIAGDPSSGLLPGIDPSGPGVEGQGDHRLQAYCLRLTLTDDPENRIPIEKPDDYDEQRYELLFRNFSAGETEVPWICSPMPNRKTDINNRTGISFDFVGQNYDYPESDYARREQIVVAHRSYTHGLLWTLANHPRVPKHVRDEVGRWGFCRDEFIATGGWTPQLYVREARRMVGGYVMTQHDCEQRRTVEDSVAMGSFQMDSHNVQRYIDSDGHVQNEGDVQEWREMDAYPISYRSIVPRAGECDNLFVTVCVSASHIAFGSLRMEPVFMMLGQSAGTAAALAIDDDISVQDVRYAELRERLLSDGQVLGR